MKKKLIIIIIICCALVLAGLFFYFLNFNKSEKEKDFINKREKEENLINFPQCLDEDEIVDYNIQDKEMPLATVEIFIKNKNTNVIKNNFRINNIRKNYYPIEIHKCGIYVIRMFNYDSKKIKQDFGYKSELWQYDYFGNGEKIILFHEQIDNYKSYYTTDFRIDSNEQYLVLEKSYLGQDDYALVIKDLNTKQDLLVLTLKEILQKYPDIVPGSFDLGKWTKDNKYFWGIISQGALDVAYYRIEAGNWKVDVYQKPPDIIAGVERATNINKLYLAYTDIPTFTGIQEIYEQIIEKAKKEGKQKNLYVYNLVTKEKTKIASTDPDKKFNLKWISDTELQYELPSGEKKVYEIE